MSILILASRRDVAALNISDKLIRNHGFIQNGVVGISPRFVRGNAILIQLDSDTVCADRIDEVLTCEAIIFASRHASTNKEPTLTTHISGNLGNDNSHGGVAKRLALANPGMLRLALVGLDRAARNLGLGNYSVSMEATHHGPTELRVPSIFVEIGSTEQEWVNPTAGEAAAQAISLAVIGVENGVPAVGFGGGHYSMKHTKTTLEGRYCVGHILPRYFFDNYDAEMVRLAFQRTLGDCRVAVVDWKGLRGGERSRLLEDLAKLEITVIRT